MTRSPSPRPPRRAAMLAAAVLVTGTAVGSLLAAAPAAGAEPRTVSLAPSTAAAIRPLCRTAWTIERDDRRLRTTRSGIVDVVTRDEAVATCLQLYRAETRLTARGGAPAPGTPVPPLPGQPAPDAVLISVTPVTNGLTAGSTTTTTPRPTPVTKPAPPSRIVTAPVPPPAAPADAAPAPAPAAAPGAAAPAGAAPVGAAPAPADTSVPIGGAAPDAAGTGVDPLAAGAPLPGALPGAVPGALPGAQPDAAAPGVDPLAPGAPVDTVGTPGTVSDPSTSTVAEAAPLDDGGGLSAALVAGVLGAVALIALLAREVAVHGVPHRIAALLPGFGRTAAPAAGASSADFTAVGFVDRWVHWDEASAAGAAGADGDVATDPVGFPPVPDDAPTGPLDLADRDDAAPAGPDPVQAAPYSLTKRSSTTRATWPPGDPNG